MKVVIVFFTVLFTIVSLAPNMRGVEYFKLTEVIEHYNEHQKSQDSFNSFFSFLKEHYSKNHKSNNDEKNFPFKSLMANSFHLIHQDYQQIEILEFDLSNSSEKVVFNYKSLFYQQNLFAIWNPPKQC
jgi:hypothetical protein